MRVVLLILLGFIVFTGCTEQRTQSDLPKAEDTLVVTTPQGDSLRMITLPTPMQVPALLKNHNLDYYPDMMIPPVRSERTFFVENVMLGMKLIDLSYAAVFNDKQAVIQQLSEVGDINRHLGISTEPDQNLMARFEANLANEDSLGHIILEYYAQGHDYFRNQNREGVGLLIIFGCYMEGMYFTFSHVRETKPELFAHLIEQQTMFAANLKLVLDRYQFPPDISQLMERFVRVEKNLKTLRIYREHHPDEAALPSHLQPMLEEVQADVFWVRSKISGSY